MRGRGEEVEEGVVRDTTFIMGETHRKFLALKVSMQYMPILV
jgi:hypothetical protein